MDTGIEKAEERVTYVSGDKEALRAYEMRQLGLSDFNTALASARNEGLKTGAEKIAHNLKALGVPVIQIVQATGLSEAQVRGL
jgi:predicted transposase/invertase (TIGR01784 family)